MVIVEKTIKRRILGLRLCVRTAVSPEARVRVGNCSVSLERSFLELPEGVGVLY